MAQHDNNFNLFDFINHADRNQIYDERTIDEDGNIIPIIDQAAIITHYSHMKGTGIQIPYTEKAKAILDAWYDYFNNNKTKLHSDDLTPKSWTD